MAQAHQKDDELRLMISGLVEHVPDFKKSQSPRRNGNDVDGTRITIARTKKKSLFPPLHALQLLSRQKQ